MKRNCRNNSQISAKIWCLFIKSLPHVKDSAELAWSDYSKLSTIVKYTTSNHEHLMCLVTLNSLHAFNVKPFLSCRLRFFLRVALETIVFNVKLPDIQTCTAVYGYLFDNNLIPSLTNWSAEVIEREALIYALTSLPRTFGLIYIITFGKVDQQKLEVLNTSVFPPLERESLSIDIARKVIASGHYITKIH